MKIGELAKRSGLAPSRIRFYEASGLLRAAQRQANGYREYAPEAQLVLALIVRAQEAGFSLGEIRSMLPDHLADWRHADLVPKLRAKVADIEAMEQRLAASKARLLEVIRQVEGKPDEMACRDNAKRMLDELVAAPPPASSPAPSPLPPEHADTAS
ncbi:MerR family transcriptional regulator [Burkholderia gladioli]|uniref:MerR family transcriptional regulator n=1 Tax=Burkholderia gladioli TaxID=28095 RepID=UPI001364A5C8|nr:MerR family transcriptional regulator [Burkholderia gladioli]KAF1059094.1 HTH-type transcriptional regulator CueR [Burkholderia gladioli]WAG23222.1 MerR family transcriptional regulator [Burkholderia gladioli]